MQERKLNMFAEQEEYMALRQYIKARVRMRPAALPAHFAAR